MTPDAYLYMEDKIATIDFEDALWRLKDLWGQPVRVFAAFRSTFGYCALQGELTRIETLPPDDSAVTILLDDRQALTIDPIDTEALLAEPDDGREWWIEFHLPSGVVISIERDSSEPLDRPAPASPLVGQGDGRKAGIARVSATASVGGRSFPDGDPRSLPAKATPRERRILRRAACWTCRARSPPKSCRAVCVMAGDAGAAAVIGDVDRRPHPRRSQTAACVVARRSW